MAFKEIHMSVIKVIEVMTESAEGWEHAAQLAVAHAAKTVRNIKSVWVQDMSAVVTDGQITGYRVNAKVSFTVD